MAYQDEESKLVTWFSRKVVRKTQRLKYLASGERIDPRGGDEVNRGIHTTSTIVLQSQKQHYEIIFPALLLKQELINLWN